MTSGRWVARPCTNPVKHDDEPLCWCSVVVVEETDETVIPSGCVSSVEAAMIVDEHNERPALLARVETLTQDLAKAFDELSDVASDTNEMVEQAWTEAARQIAAWLREFYGPDGIHAGIADRIEAGAWRGKGRPA